MGIPPKLAAINRDMNAMRVAADDTLPIRMYSRKMIRLKLVHGNQSQRSSFLPFLRPLSCATTPSSTHPSIELFTSRSPDTTPKLYPGDDPITLGEGRRSGADASSHSRSTRSITDRNCNTKGLQESQCYHNALLSPTTANNQFKPIGARSELLNSHLHNNNNHFNATLNSEYGCGVDGLVAMGNHTMTMPRNGRCLYVNGLSSALQTSGAQYTVSMRKANKSSNMGTPGSSVKQAAGKEAEPKYTDPFQGAPHDFQQRIAELALLEADTIRNERYRKAKRKTRMDKDS